MCWVDFGRLENRKKNFDFFYVFFLLPCNATGNSFVIKMKISYVAKIVFDIKEAVTRKA